MTILEKPLHRIENGQLISNKMPVNPLHILLVDDDQDDHYFFETALKENEIPANISHAKNGAEALDHLKQKSWLPNIIFLDINMPVMDGLTVLEQIRANKGYKDVQVIVFSTSEDPVLIRRAYEHGAQLYLRKPDHFTDYKLLLGSLLAGMAVPEAFIRR